MAKIYVKTPFELQHGQEKLKFGIGTHEVDADVAAHWYVQHHIGEDPDAGQSADDEAADALLAELDGREQELRTVASDLQQRAKELIEQGDLVAAAKQDVADREEAVAKREAAVASAEETAKAKATELEQREAAVAESEKAAATKAESTKTSKK